MHLIIFFVSTKWHFESIFICTTLCPSSGDCAFVDVSRILTFAHCFSTGFMQLSSFPAIDTSMKRVSKDMVLYSIFWSIFSGSTILELWHFGNNSMNQFVASLPHFLTSAKREELCISNLIEQMCSHLFLCICWRQQILWHCALSNEFPLFLRIFVVITYWNSESIYIRGALCTLCWDRTFADGSRPFLIVHFNCMFCAFD